ncbi:hypothetical protein NP569_26835, partial [Vibrio parahaemolyticus]|nr:hypothetical protein [Vibrio parahaemolyticus]
GFLTTGLPSVARKSWQSPVLPVFTCVTCPLVFSDDFAAAQSLQNITWGFVYGRGLYSLG